MRRLSWSLLSVLLVVALGAGVALDGLFVRVSGSRTPPLLEWRQLGRALADQVAVSPDRAAAVQRVAASGVDASLLPRAALPSAGAALDAQALDEGLSGRTGLALQSSQTLFVYYALDDAELLSLSRNAQQDATLLRFVLTSTFYLALLAAALLWLVPLLRRLGRLAQAARAFGRGELAVRLGGRGNGELDVVERAFDAMAERITRLLDDNRLLGSGVAHDLKTPLARLRFGIDSLDPSESIAPATPQQLRDRVQRLQADLDAMERLLEDMLAYARFDVTSAARSLVPLDLGVLVGERVALWPAAAASWQPPTADVTVRGEPRELTALIDNLLGNAVRHGAGSALATVAPTAAGGAVFGVHDDGDGLPVAERTQLLRPFEQGRGRADTSAVDRVGHGLGLALVARIAERHGAELHIGRSARLGGAEVRVEFPPQGRAPTGKA